MAGAGGGVEQASGEPAAQPEHELAALDDATELLGLPGGLAARFEQTGACLVRRLLPADAVAPVRRAVLVVLADAGLLAPELSGDVPADQLPAGDVPAEGVTREPADAPGSAPAPAAARPGGEVDPALYRRLFGLRELHELIHHERIRQLMERLLGTAELVVHPRPAVRVVPPPSRRGGLGPTPAHQDHLGMQGSARAVVCWIPLVDCPLELGPIAVAEGSHRLGRLPYAPLAGARVLTCDAGALGRSWRSSPLRAGDAVVFSALTVHRALPNRSRRLRLSVDLRCQPAGEPLCELSVREDPAQSWDELYAGLPASSPVVAWRAMPLRLEPFDTAVLRPAPAAEKGAGGTTEQSSGLR